MLLMLLLPPPLLLVVDFFSTSSFLHDTRTHVTHSTKLPTFFFEKAHGSWRGWYWLPARGK